MAINKNDYLDGNGNYDLKKALVDELIDGINGKIDSGSNENGSYIKFDDGTMICWNTVELGSIVTNGNGSYENPYRTPSSSAVFASSFSTPPLLNLRAFIELPGIAQSIQRLVVYSGKPTTTSVPYLQASRMNPSNQDDTVYCDILAIGRWK